MGGAKTVSPNKMKRTGETFILVETLSFHFSINLNLCLLRTSVSKMSETPVLYLDGESLTPELVRLSPYQSRFS